MPIKGVQELAKEEGEESEAKLKAMARHMEGDFQGVPILYGGSRFALGQPQQVETNSGALACSSSSLLAPSIRA